MKIDQSWERLKKGHLWHFVDMGHNKQIAKQLSGCNSVLDLGCGYGSLTAYLNSANINTVGIDSDEQVVKIAHELFPTTSPDHFQVMDGESLSFPNDRFDGIVLRDTLHHLWEETNIESTFDEIERVLKPSGILVIFDPNPSLILRMCRYIARHKDAQCSYQEALALLQQRKWKIQNTFFTEFCALAVSGGYVGIELSPGWIFFQKIILDFDRIMTNVFSRLGLGSTFLWRYCITANSPKLRIP